MRYILVLILLCGLTWVSGCRKSVEGDVTISPPEGISYSPVKPYQEALPGSIITFQVRVKSPEPVTSFGVRFKFPGSNDYVSLPQYPDVTETSEFTAGNGEFEYALPPSAVVIDADMKFKFIGTTASRTYEGEYTVKMKSLGLQAVRLYRPSNSIFKFAAFDLLNTAGVAVSGPATTKDLVTYISYQSYRGQDYPLTTGFSSQNNTLFKLADAAKYTANPSTYAAAFNSIAVANQFTTLSVNADVLVPGMGLLRPNSYYIARVNRNNVFSYVGIRVVNVPISNLITSTPVPAQSPGNDKVDLEIKK